ncbi:MAG: ABC transporter permease [Pseudomonadota bacterium]
MRLLLSLLLRAVVVLTGAAFATFALLWHAPGDPALAIALARYDALVDADLVNQVRDEVGLSAGFWPAFFGWIGPLLQGDFGNSSVTGRPVLPDMMSAISYTFPLALAALVVGIVLSVPLALLAAKRPGSWVDRFAIAISSLGAAIPTFWLGLLLILLFAVQLSWLPAMGARTPAHAVLPALTLGLGVAASLTRIIRSGILEARGQPFLPAFRRRGVTNAALNRDHVAPHAAIPVITVLGLEIAFLLEGLVALEVIFARPGLGSFLVQAILARDFPKVQAVVILTALVFVIVNLLIDLLYRAVDPRIEVSGSECDA